MIGPSKLPLRSVNCAFAEFNPDELPYVAGMPAQAADEWNSTGDMPWGLGAPDSVSAVEAVRMTLAYKLASLGWGQRESMFVVGRSIPILFFEALTNVEGAIQISGLPEKLEKYTTSFLASPDHANKLTGGPYSERFLRRNDVTGEFYLVCGPGSGEARKPLSDLIDLRELALELCFRAKRPLLSVELVDDQPYGRERPTWLSSNRRFELVHA